MWYIWSIDWLNVVKSRIQDLLKERLITQDDFPWKLPIPSSSGNVVVEEEEGTLLKYVGGVDVSYSKELDSAAAAASTAACGCGSLVVLDVTTPTLQVVYQDFFLLTNFDVPYIPSFLAFREVSRIYYYHCDSFFICHWWWWWFLGSNTLTTLTEDEKHWQSILPPGQPIHNPLSF